MVKLRCVSYFRENEYHGHGNKEKDHKYNLSRGRGVVTDCVKELKMRFDVRKSLIQ